jgi:hypothetical protein
MLREPSNPRPVDRTIRPRRRARDDPQIAARARKPRKHRRPAIDRFGSSPADTEAET